MTDTPFPEDVTRPPAQGKTPRTPMLDPESLLLRARRLLLVVVITFAVLIATHDGEFWPFSIYPMFSRGGRPWERVVLVDAPSDAEAYAVLHGKPLDRLPGSVVSLDSAGMTQNDLTVFIEKTTNWDTAQRASLQHLVQSASTGRNRWLIYSIRATLTDSATVALTATPMILVTPDTVALRMDPIPY